TEAQDRTADNEADETVGQREDKGATAGKQEQRALDGLGVVAVEQNAEGELHRGEHQEVDRGQETKIRRADVKLGDEIAGDQRVDAAEEVGQIVARSKGKQH